jgi:hypothetical protein
VSPSTIKVQHLTKNKNPDLRTLSIAFYRSVAFFKVYFSRVCHLEKIQLLTLEKHFMKSIKYKKYELYIENFQKIFFNAFNTIMQQFFTTLE